MTTAFPRITDTTLRDGSHPMRHQFTVEQVTSIVSLLDRAGIPVIEVGHGNGIGGSSLQYGLSGTYDMDLILRAVETAKQARIAVLLAPGIGTRRDVQEAANRGVQIVRIATQCSEADVSEQHFSIAKRMGLEAIGFLMMAHMLEPRALAAQALRMQAYGADAVCIVDSAGALLPDGVYARIAALVEALSIPVGYHAHNNLGLAIGNTLAALDAGATQVDGCLRGLGAGAGNAATEILVAVLSRRCGTQPIDVFALTDAAEFIVAPMMPYQPLPDRDAIASGYAGVHTTFLLHARRAGERHGVDPRAILLELGSRHAVAGQEDLILEVAMDLARASGTARAAVAAH
jgi:4-hydroxy 2-oxovalerate aldolase